MIKIFSYKFNLFFHKLIKTFSKLDTVLLIIFVFFIYGSPKHYDIRDLNASLDQSPIKRGLLFKIEGNLIYENNSLYLITNDNKSLYNYKIILDDNLSKKEFLTLKKKSENKMSFLLKHLNTKKDEKNNVIFKLKLIKIL